jgi:hypothetical protein
MRVAAAAHASAGAWRRRAGRGHGHQPLRQKLTQQLLPLLLLLVAACPLRAIAEGGALEKAAADAETEQDAEEAVLAAAAKANCTAPKVRPVFHRPHAPPAPRSPRTTCQAMALPSTHPAGGHGH